MHISLIFSNFVENYKHLKTMKKSESTSRKETPEEELKRLRKENQSLKSDLKKVDKQHERMEGQRSSRAREFHPHPLTEPCVKVSPHTALHTQRFVHRHNLSQMV